MTQQRSEWEPQADFCKGWAISGMNLILVGIHATLKIITGVESRVPFIFFPLPVLQIPTTSDSKPSEQGWHLSCMYIYIYIYTLWGFKFLHAPQDLNVVRICLFVSGAL